MKYNLKTPCEDCPFRMDKQPFIRSERVEEIAYGGAEFACHKTVDYVDDDNGDGAVTSDSQHCAGLLILLEKEEMPHQMMRISERIGLYDRSTLDMEAPVYDSIEDVICAHENEETA